MAPPARTPATGRSVPLPRPLARALLGAGEAARLARGETPLLVALSGGADSVSLLRALVRVRAARGAKPPYGLSAAHFNHGIRGAEADADEAFCVALCDSLGVPFAVGRGDVPAEAATTGESHEMAARRLRRDFLVNAAALEGAEAIALAHTLDDQLELFLLRLARGAGLRGLAGMPPVADAGLRPDVLRGTPADRAPRRPVRLRLVRPFLSLRHADLVAFLRAEGLDWREDSTNAGDAPLRNRIRHHAVPALLGACGAGLPATLDRTLSLLREDADLLDALAAAEPWAPGDPAAALAAGPAPVARRRVARALYDAGADPESVSLAAVERVRALAASGRNGSVPLGGALEARLAYGSLSFQTRAATPAPETAGTPFVFPAAAALPARGARPDPEGRLVVRRADAVRRPARGNFVGRPVSASVRAGALDGRRVVLRPWRAGDRIAAAGGRGTRKLSDVFTDAKLPRDMRARVLVLADADSGAVLWLPGHGVARELAVRPGDAVLSIALVR
ncbi:MAG: tRNA lysidine(34) synthetase TilS [Kiritimatiellae bacterium]|nr:tRNA lysidine(34) synthetase TilS [Kiritimatiellia bacterium]